MRIIYFDIDCLRPDHLGCYGYHRNTSPNIDRIAEKGVRFDNCYASDSPCLPSRTALFGGRFGLHTGVINHGGQWADRQPLGPERGFNNCRGPFRSWMSTLRQKGIYTASVSPFATRHAAFHFYDGFREMLDTGKNGLEAAHEITPTVRQWLARMAKEDNWFLHVNYWDPHTPYRTPPEFGDPFSGDPLSAWMTEEIIAAQQESFGPHGARELYEWGPYDTEKYPHLPATITNLEDFRKWINAYDTGVRYADEHVGIVLNDLADAGVLDDTIVIISADHGENLGELNVYGDHQTADQFTNRVPLIISGPGISNGVRKAFHYQLDMAATTAELAGSDIPEKWDAESFLPGIVSDKDEGREFLVISQGAWSCQRAARWDKWLLVRTYDDGLKDFPESMLFDLEADPHETVNLATAQPKIVEHGLELLQRWYSDNESGLPGGEDPMWKVQQEGGPFHTRGKLNEYAEYLRQTGREPAAKRMLARHGQVFT